MRQFNKVKKEKRTLKLNLFHHQSQVTWSESNFLISNSMIKDKGFTLQRLNLKEIQACLLPTMFPDNTIPFLKSIFFATIPITTNHRSSSFDKLKENYGYMESL